MNVWTKMKVPYSPAHDATSIQIVSHRGVIEFNIIVSHMWKYTFNLLLFKKAKDICVWKALNVAGMDYVFRLKAQKRRRKTFTDVSAEYRPIKYFHGDCVCQNFCILQHDGISFVECCVYVCRINYSRGWNMFVVRELLSVCIVYVCL